MTIFANARHDKFLVATLALFQIWVCVLFSANAARNMIVYFPTVQYCARTLFFQESQSAPMLVSAANASVSVANDTDANAGVFGTDVENFGPQGRRTAGIAVNIVNGGRPGIPFVRDADIYLFDRRALKRRALENIDVPAKSVVTDEQPAIWQAFRQIMIPGIVLLFAQGLIIISLFRQRAKSKKISEALVLSSDRLRLAMKTGKTVGWECDLANRTAFLFGDLHSKFGIPLDTSTVKLDDFYGYVREDDRQRVQEAIADARESRTPYVQEFRIVWPKGSTTHWVACRGKFEYASNGQPVRMRGLAVDITERRQIEETLKKSEEKFSKVFRESPLAL